jgi:GMP synthase (glutamine-hydrolysing)
MSSAVEPSRTGVAPATVVILDFGAQYSQLIARRVREANVYSEILPHDTPWEEIAARNPAAVLLTGGPESTLEPDAPGVDPNLWTSGLPILGICYGLQLIARDLGGELARSSQREFGPASLEIVEDSALSRDVPARSRAWMSHGDTVSAPPAGFHVLARTPTCGVAAMGDAARRIYGVQFHPEVGHTEAGTRILTNFLHSIAGIAPTWQMDSFVDRAVADVRATVGDSGRVVRVIGGRRFGRGRDARIARRR